MMYKYNKLGEFFVKTCDEKEERIKELEKEYERLKQQIEKMKCCGNCKYEPVYDKQGDCLIAEECHICFYKSNWEVRK